MPLKLKKKKKSQLNYDIQSPIRPKGPKISETLPWKGRKDVWIRNTAVCLTSKSSEQSVVFKWVTCVEQESSWGGVRHVVATSVIIFVKLQKNIIWVTLLLRV